MPDTNFYQPVKIGRPAADGSGRGTVSCAQTVTLTQNSTNVVNATMVIPAGRIVDILVDGLVVWNSAVSAGLTVGTASAGTQFSSSIDVKTATRVRPTFTAAQLAALALTADTTVYVTVTPSGATSAGTTRVTIIYEPS